MKVVKIPQELWFQKREIRLTFPDRWHVENCPMASDTWKMLSDREIEKAVNNPIGSERLEGLAKGKKEAVILFDDMTRPTRPHRVAPYILQKLLSNGLKKENVRFIAASGSHGACNYEDFRKKLGSDIVANYPVYNHNSFENCGYVGEASGGVPVSINKEFLSCGLRIGIGSVMPHIYCGFSGGGKIVLPGISHIDTIHKFHLLGERPHKPGKLKRGQMAHLFYGALRSMVIRSIYDAVRLSGLSFKIDFVMNSNGEEVGCFAGDPIEAFKRAVEFSRNAYSTLHGKDYDVIIANAYSKSNEADLALHNVKHLLSSKGGILILVADNPQGQINHYLLRSYGKFIGGRHYRKRTFLKEDVKYIIFSPHKDYSAFDTFDRPELLVWKERWDEILKIIRDKFPNPKIAVFPDASIQLLNSSLTAAGGRPARGTGGANLRVCSGGSEKDAYEQG